MLPIIFFLNSLKNIPCQVNNFSILSFHRRMVDIEMVDLSLESDKPKVSEHYKRESLCEPLIADRRTSSVSFNVPETNDPARGRSHSTTSSWFTFSSGTRSSVFSRRLSVSTMEFYTTMNGKMFNLFCLFSIFFVILVFFGWLFYSV